MTSFQQPPPGQTPEQLEQFYINQVSQVVTNDTMMVQQQFQKYQQQATMSMFFGMNNGVDPRIWHVNHLFEFRHFIEGYANVEQFFLSKGLNRFSGYLNLIRADINKALVTYGAAAVPMAQQPAMAQNPVVDQQPGAAAGGGTNYIEQQMKIQQDLNDYATKSIQDTNKNWQDTFDKTNAMWDSYFKS